MIQKKIGSSLFNIPFWQIQIINFEEKKKELVKLLESYPEEKEKYEERVEDHFGNLVTFCHDDPPPGFVVSSLNEFAAAAMGQEPPEVS